MVGIDISGTLIITGVLWFGIGIWFGEVTLHNFLNYEQYIQCLPIMEGKGIWSDADWLAYKCQNLYLYNVAPTLFLIVGIIAKLFR